MENNCKETCISKILEFILELQKNTECQNLDNTGCDKPCLGPNVNGFIYNTRPITLYCCSTGTLWSMPYTLNGETGTSTVFKINKDNSKNEEENSGENNKKQETTVAQDLRLAIVNYDSINPILSKNSNVQDISRIVFEPLITLSKDYKPEGCLATEWSISGDNSYIIKLRDNVKWHDGSSFTSKDVQFTIDKLKNIDSIYSANVQHVVQVEVIDDYTIKITLDGKDPYFEYNLTFPILSNNFYLEQDFQF